MQTWTRWTRCRDCLSNCGRCAVVLNVFFALAVCAVGVLLLIDRSLLLDQIDDHIEVEEYVDEGETASVLNKIDNNSTILPTPRDALISMAYSRAASFFVTTIIIMFFSHACARRSERKRERKKGGLYKLSVAKKFGWKETKYELLPASPPFLSCCDPPFKPGPIITAVEAVVNAPVMSGIKPAEVTVDVAEEPVAAKFDVNTGEPIVQPPPAKFDVNTGEPIVQQAAESTPAEVTEAAESTPAEVTDAAESTAAEVTEEKI